MRPKLNNVATIALIVGLTMSLGKKCDDSDTEEDQQYWLTCGDPVCNSYSGPFEGVDLCSDLGISLEDECPADDDGLTCDPEDGCNALLICAATDPTQQTGGCPISLAKHKDEIEYLDGAERAAASRAVLDMKLATWRYKGDLDDGATHLGFIIDDVPGSPAVRPDGGHVDLYGYTSMAVAALQQQQAEIDALREDIKELKAAAGTCPRP